MLSVVGCVAAIRFAACPSARALAWSLLGIAIIANAGWYYKAMWLLPVIDMVAGCVALGFRAEGKWVALFVRAIAVRLILHILNAATNGIFFNLYAHALNATFAWMLLLVAYGGDHEHRFDGRDHLRRLFHRRSKGAPALLARGTS